MAYSYYELDYDYEDEYAPKRRKNNGKGFGWILYRIFVWISIIVCMFALAFAFKARKNPTNAGVTVFGTQIRVVLSDSMAACAETDVSEYEIKSLPVNTLIAIDVVPEGETEAKAWYDSLKVGDVLTFRYVYNVKQETITHRIIEITPKGEGYVIELQGDNKNADSEALTQTIDTTLTDSTNYVIGKVIWENQIIGKFVSKLNTPIGIICFIILPALILFAIEVSVFVKNRYEKKMSQMVPSYPPRGRSRRGGYGGNDYYYRRRR